MQRHSTTERHAARWRGRLGEDLSVLKGLVRVAHMNKSGVNDLPAPARKQIEVFIYIYIYIRVCLTQNNLICLLITHEMEYFKPFG